jgi:hypothetical protein
MIAYNDRKNHTIQHQDIVRILAISDMTPERCSRIYRNEWGHWSVDFASESDKIETMKVIGNYGTMERFGIIEITQEPSYI